MALKGTLTLASPDYLSCAQSITNQLSDKLNESVDFEIAYDSSIIGGFIAEVGGRYYDASIAERLFRMKQYILG